MGSPTFGLALEVPITLTVTSANGLAETRTTRVQVRKDGSVVERNHPPVISAILAAPALQPGAILLEARATDEDGDDLTYTWTPLRGSTTGNGSRVVWAPNGGTPSSDGILVTVTDIADETARDALVFKVDRSGNVDVASGARLPSPVVEVPTLTRSDLLPPPGTTIGDLVLDLVPGQKSTLDAPDIDGRAEAGFATTTLLAAEARLSDGTINRAVTWSSGDPSRAKVDFAGRVTVQPDAPPGIVAIRATSFVDPSKEATIPLLIQANGRLALELR